MLKRRADEAGLDAANMRPTTAPRVLDPMPPPPPDPAAIAQQWAAMISYLDEATVRHLLAITLTSHAQGYEATVSFYNHAVMMRDNGAIANHNQAVSYNHIASQIQATNYDQAAAATLGIDFNHCISQVEEVYETYSDSRDSREYDNSFDAVCDIEGIINDIVTDATAANATVSTKRSALETLCDIGEIIVEEHGSCLGSEIRKRFQGPSCLDEGMENILNEMEEAEGVLCMGEIGEKEGWQLVDDTESLMRTASDYGVMSRLEAVVALMNEFAVPESDEDDDDGDNDEDEDEDE